MVSTDGDRHGLQCPPLIRADVREGVAEQDAACQQLLWARNRLLQQQFKGETLPCRVAGIGVGSVKVMDGERGAGFRSLWEVSVALQHV